MWTPKQKEWQEADLGSQAAQQGLKPANFEFLAYDFACQSTTHANMHGRLHISLDGVWLYSICAESSFREATVERAWALPLPPKRLGKASQGADVTKCKFRSHPTLKTQQAVWVFCASFHYPSIYRHADFLRRARDSGGESSRTHSSQNQLCFSKVCAEQMGTTPTLLRPCSDISKPNSSSVWLKKDTCMTVTRTPYLWKAHTSKEMANRSPFSLGCECCE